MIIGIGNDYVDVRRIESAMERFGDIFINRIFTKKEQEKAASRGGSSKHKAATYAKRWAAKEAFSKALGTGMRGISWQDIEITNLESGKPVITVFGSAKAKLAELTPKDKVVSINVTLTDDYPKASAVVIISAD